MKIDGVLKMMDLIKWEVFFYFICQKKRTEGLIRVRVNTITISTHFTKKVTQLSGFQKDIVFIKSLTTDTFKM